MKINRVFKAIAVVMVVCISLGLSAGALDIITLSVTSEDQDANYPPIAENLSLTTYRNVSVQGNFSATDPEGDSVSFRLVNQPKKGTVEITDGSFIYTPKDGKKGKDCFSYVASDSSGNVSDEATVNIKIEKQSTKVSYSDMDDNGAGYAAVRLAEKGIYTGEKLGANYFFKPDDSISRGEFLAMCLKAADIDPLDGITHTGFYDDSEIPLWEKPYVSTALIDGVVQGYSADDGSIIFSSNNAVSWAEAAVMLNNTLQISDVKSSSALTDEAVPAWAAQAAANLDACSIISADTTDYSGSLTHAQAAEMLSSAMDLIENRDDGGSLLSWAW